MYKWPFGKMSENHENGKRINRKKDLMVNSDGQSKSVSDASSNTSQLSQPSSLTWAKNRAGRRKSFMQATIAAARKKEGGARSPDKYSGIESWKNSLRQGETEKNRKAERDKKRKNEKNIKEKCISVKNKQKNISCLTMTIKREVRSSPALRKVTNVTSISRVKTAKGRKTKGSNMYDMETLNIT